MNRFHRWYCRSSHWRDTLADRVLPWALAGVELGDDVLEIGPGPGLSTDVLARRGVVTVAEIDPRLATALHARCDANSVRVARADATRLPFRSARFSAVVCFTMLHHVPSPDLQDRLLVEACRVLRPGGIIAGTDSTPTLAFRAAHLFDTMTLIDPHGLPERLRRAGFAAARVTIGSGAFRFRAHKTAATVPR